MKTCNICRIEKEETEFYIKDKVTNRLDSKCKSCVKQDRSVYYKENKEVIQKTHKLWYENNKEHVFQNVIRWQKNNPDKVRQYNRNSTAKLRAENPDKLTERNRNKEKRLREKLINRLAKGLRNRLRAILQGKIKAGSSVRDLGCSLEDLKSYLETKWTEGMSWDNYGHGMGKWNIDHIIPLSAFDLTNRQHVVLACHHLNLQPLWHEDNVRKGNKFEFQF